MEKSLRTDKQITADVKTAGQSFLGLKMENMLLRIPELDDKLLKKKLIEEYYETQDGFHDTEIKGTNYRVNALVRIIKSDKVIYALEHIDGTDRRVDPRAVHMAQETIRKIKSGELKLPVLD